MKDNYRDKFACTYSVFPSQKISDVLTEPYNATLAINQLLENADQTTIIDNEALANITLNTLKLAHCKYSDLNWLISCFMGGATATLRCHSMFV